MRKDGCDVLIWGLYALVGYVDGWTVRREAFLWDSRKCSREKLLSGGQR